jgi:hypothetical protein
MSARKILLVLGWALVGVSLYPNHAVFDDARGKGSRWSIGIPSSPLLLRENIEEMEGAAGSSTNTSFHRELEVKLIGLSALSLLAGALLVSAANKLRPSTLRQPTPPMG